APALTGSESASNGDGMVQGAGGDIWGTSGQVHYVWQIWGVDGTLSVHVASQSNTSPWAKAGVMFRVSTKAGAPFYDAVVTPGNGIAIQYRAVAGGSAQQITPISGKIPTWLKVARSGTTFS